MTTYRLTDDGTMMIRDMTATERRAHVIADARRIRAMGLPVDATWMRAEGIGWIRRVLIARGW